MLSRCNVLEEAQCQLEPKVQAGDHSRMLAFCLVQSFADLSFAKMLSARRWRDCEQVEAVLQTQSSHAAHRCLGPIDSAPKLTPAIRIARAPRRACLRGCPIVAGR